MKKKLIIIPKQVTSFEVNNIFAKMLMRLCIDEGLTNKLIMILQDCGIKYEVEEMP